MHTEPPWLEPVPLSSRYTLASVLSMSVRSVPEWNSTYEDGAGLGL